MSIFPEETTLSSVIEETLEKQELPLFKEYAYDLKENKFVYENGRNVIVEGNEALKIWIYKALKTPRYRYLGYSWNYGNELEEELIGKSLTKGIIESEGKRLIEECLLANPYILSIDNFNIEIDGNIITLSFRANTIYGEVNMIV